MRARLYILINGILTIESDIDAWNDVGEAWIDDHTPYKATRDKYFSTALLGRLWQPGRVTKLLKLMARYPDLDLVLVGHSNGCDIICRVLQSLLKDLSKTQRVLQIHLFAGACEADFEKNGIGEAIRTGLLEAAHIYGSDNDTALRLARDTSPFLLSPLRYGFLGLVGPQNVNPFILPQVIVNWNNSFNHSTWFKDENFENTMRLIVGAPPVPALLYR